MIDNIENNQENESSTLRQVVLDTETTGLSPAEGHRVIEIGAIELIERRPTGRRLHFYLNPDRQNDEDAVAVHGLSDEFLAEQRRFHEIHDELLAFLNGAELIIHNAEFDVGFLNHELQICQSEISQLSDICSVLDTLKLARQMHPGQPNSLDALCRRYEVDNSNRQIHGALLDSELLLNVFLAMTGEQKAFELGIKQSSDQSSGAKTVLKPVRVIVSTEEQRQHQSRMATLAANQTGTLPDTQSG